MSADAQARMAYLRLCVDVLWPGLGHDGSDEARMVVLPSTRAPRVLAPAPPRRAAAAAVRHYTAQQGRVDRAAGAVLAASVYAGLGRALPTVRSSASAARRVPAAHGAAAATDAGSIDQHLGQVLGRRVVTSLALTRDRPNRKPVLQVFDTLGTTIAFAKVGVSALAGRLVDAEAAALRHLGQLGESPLGGVEIPRVLHHGRWRDYPVLVASALVAGAAVEVDDPALDDAMREIAGAFTGDIDSYVAALRARAQGAGGPADEWSRLFDELVTARDFSSVPVGAWHGDWTTWNCGRHGRQIVVWDWERFSAPAPLGFDKLHFVLNDAVGPHRDRFQAAATDLIARAGTTLARWHLTSPDATSVALLYVMDIALRYLADDARASDPGGMVEQWALPAVRSALSAARTGSQQ